MVKLQLKRGQKSGISGEIRKDYCKFSIEIFFPLLSTNLAKTPPNTAINFKRNFFEKVLSNWDVRLWVKKWDKQWSKAGVLFSLGDFLAQSLEAGAVFCKGSEPFLRNVGEVLNKEFLPQELLHDADSKEIRAPGFPSWRIL